MVQDTKKRYKLEKTRGRRFSPFVFISFKYFGILLTSELDPLNKKVKVYAAFV